MLKDSLAKITGKEEAVRTPAGKRREKPQLRYTDVLCFVHHGKVKWWMLALSEQRSEAAQHKGLGRALMQEAERIAVDEFQVRQIKVLSGTGARQYYQTEFDYELLGNYMVKNLRPQD